MRRHLSVALLVCVVAAGASVATAGTAGKPVTYQFDFGYSMVQGKASDALEDGWTIGFGSVIRPWAKKPFGIRWDFTYDWWDVNTGNIPELDGIRVDDGDGDQWTLRTGIQYESHGDKAKFIGGVGIGAYRLNANISETVIVPGYICDPYWWWYCYPGLVEGDVLLRNKTLTKFGYYATAGVSFPLSNSDIYIEAQYHRVNVEEYFETLPIVIGWRF
jgi:opacity protein-like surface antigen